MQFALKLIALCLLSIAVANLIWARLRIFEVNAKNTKPIGISYDLLVTLHLVGTTFGILRKDLEPNLNFLLGTFVYITALFLFRACINQVNRIAFAQEATVSEIITTGPFSAVRHPFYISYTLIWLASLFFVNEYYLWISLALLCSFYIYSAFKEESMIMRSGLRSQFSNYQKTTGMFFPKVKQWKIWFFNISKTKLK